MPELSPAAFNIAIAVVGVLLYLFAWRSTRDMPMMAKVLSRLILALVAIIPAVLAIMLGADKPAMQRKMEAQVPPATAPAPRPMSPQATAPTAPAPTASAPPAGGSAPPPAAPQASAPPAPPQPSPPPAGGSAPPPMPAPAAAPPPAPAGGSASAPADSLPSAAPPDARTRSTAPPRPITAPAPEIAMQKESASAPRSLPAPTVGAPPPASPDYDVVPVFYGTDRGAKQTGKRVEYDAERGKRLELGRAMVTVPKVHEVPQIERPWAYRIPLTNIVIYQEAEDPKKHFTMQEVKALTKDEYLRFVRERLAASSRFKDHAVVFIHGFNTTFDYAVYRAAQMAYDLKFDGAPFVYSWPSKGQLGLQDYGYDRGSAEQAEPYLKEFLNLVTRESGAKTVSIIAHSMGNLVLLPVLRDLKNAAPPGVTISQLILAAPDVDRDRFEQLAKDIRGIANGTTLYVASNDWALELSKRLAGSVARAGDVPASGPLMIDGIDTIDVTDTSTDIFALHHSGYAEKVALIEDIGAIILTGKRPPEARVPPLQRVLIEKGIYWRYPAAKP